MPDGIFWLPDPLVLVNQPRFIPLLTRLISRDRKIITVEDPVEYEVQGSIRCRLEQMSG